MSSYLVAALYHFAPLAADADTQSKIKAVCEENGICGTLLLASEGINGTIAGTPEGIANVLAYLRAIPGFAALEHKESQASEQPFLRLKVRLKKEIVTMGIPGVDPNALVGTYVDPEDWNDLISADDVVTIDTRNDYEIRIGQFKGAINPETVTFREFPDWFRKFKQGRPNARVAMYCTGGIRCEKSTSFVKQEGIDEVYHLKGGILKYLEVVPEKESLWEGECFVFDRRVAVKHGLEEGSYTLCHACREPLGPEDLKSEYFVPGTSCPYCHDKRSAADQARYAERERQEQLAADRGETHLGSVGGNARD
ncbi:rhodanese-related sulfurtransferase [Maricaulis sp.]|uniref:oxygen-dependent tRNA uridine(34) hydroxylase TrhO n=1 Tax=unclassified Maricaulis TaxID=2632371 RepID=UPI001B2343AC|nr:rhodanese-related sulfurtransferase [Maricaulis sp.]MBO6798086.1 rhodanese-related sulfurtransferase [Maricaulis sp.]